MHPSEPDPILLKGDKGSEPSFWSVSQQKLLTEWKSSYNDLFAPIHVTYRPNCFHLGDMQLLINYPNRKAVDILDGKNGTGIIASYPFAENEVIESLCLSKDKSTVVVTVNNEKDGKQFQALNLKGLSFDGESRYLQTEADISDLEINLSSDGSLFFCLVSRASFSSLIWFPFVIVF